MKPPAESNVGTPETSGRRSFLNYLLGTSIGATLVAVFYPIIKFVVPPQIIEAAQSSVVAGKVSELAVKLRKDLQVRDQTRHCCTYRLRRSEGLLGSLHSPRLYSSIPFGPEADLVCLP